MDRRTWLGAALASGALVLTSARTAEAQVFPEGALIKGTGPRVYVMHFGRRCWIYDPPTFNALGLSWSAIQTISDSLLASIPEGVMVVDANASFGVGTLLKGRDARVYIVRDNQRRWIHDEATFNAMGLSWSAIRTIPDEVLFAIPEGPSI